MFVTELDGLTLDCIHLKVSRNYRANVAGNSNQLNKTIIKSMLNRTVKIMHQ